MKKTIMIIITVLALSICAFTGCSSKMTAQEDRAYVENGTIYITENGETYPYGAGIYYDEEEERGFVWFDVGKDDEGNLNDQVPDHRHYSNGIGCDGDIAAARSKVENGTLYDETESFYEVDILGRKGTYYPNEGVWGDEENGYYVYSYNGKALYLENYTPPTEQAETNFQ